MAGRRSPIASAGILPPQPTGGDHRADHRDPAASARRRAAGGSASSLSAARGRPVRRLDRLAVLRGRRHLGHQHPGQLGPGRSQLRLVDRHGQRRHPDLGAAAGARPRWRNSLNRFAEAMTRVRRRSAPGIYPIIHLGRPWFFYWLFPYPNAMDALAAVPQPAGVGRLRGADLPDRLGAVLVHRPDPRPRQRCATARARAWRRCSTACCALGWRGSAVHWARWQSGLPDDRHPRGAAGRLGAQRRRPAATRSAPARLALDDLSAVLRDRRGRSTASRSCAMIADRAAPAFGLQQSRHRPAPRHPRRGPARDRPDDGLLLPVRGVHRLVLGRCVRAPDALRPLVRHLRLDLLGRDRLHARGRPRCSGSRRRAATQGRWRWSPSW